MHHQLPSHPAARRVWGALALAVVLAACASAPEPRSAPAPTERTPLPELAAFSARLSGRDAVPSNDSAAQGELVDVLNRNTGLLRWKLSFSQLSGPVRGGHFHSPGMDGEVAPAVLPLGRGIVSPYEGRAMLTSAQRANLLAGQWYVNLPTTRYPRGELRGQLIERR